MSKVSAIVFINSWFVPFDWFLIEFASAQRQAEGMGVTAFIASGTEFEVDRYLEKCPFKPSRVFRKGEIPPKDNPELSARPDSGFVVLLGQDKAPGIASQTSEVLLVLQTYEAELEGLRGLGVDTMLIDLGVEGSDQLQQSEYIQPSLIVALAHFRMGLIISTIRFGRG